MKTPRFEASVSYAGEDITVGMESKTSSFSYGDPDGGGSDTCKLVFADDKNEWMQPANWPKKGDKFSAHITVNHWDGPMDASRALQCGTFTLDRPQASGPPTIVSIAGVSQPANKDFKDTDRTKTWERVTLQQILQDTASMAGIALHYDGPNIPIGKEEQNEPNASFSQKMCDRYGFRMKIYSDRLVAFHRATYKQKPPVRTFTLDLRNLGPWDYDDSMEPYTGAELVYTDAASGKEIKANIGGGDRILKLNNQADNGADAERIAQAELEAANHSAVTLSFTTRGDVELCASQVIEVQGLGEPDGLYYIDRIDHDCRRGTYEITLRLSKIL